LATVASIGLPSVHMTGPLVTTGCNALYTSAILASGSAKSVVAPGRSLATSTEMCSLDMPRVLTCRRGGAARAGNPLALVGAKLVGLVDLDHLAK